jgi:hypothetical protein
VVSPLSAATYYVEDKGSAVANHTDQGSSAWISATSISTPCSAGTAMARAVAGDIVNFRDGTYLVSACPSDGYRASLQPVNSGLDGLPITFQAYVGESPLIHCPSVNSGWEMNFNIGTGGQDYIIWDGFECTAGESSQYIGGAYFGGESGYSDYCIFRNLNLHGSAEYEITTTDNCYIIRTNRARYGTIERCTLGNAKQESDWHNTAAIGSYACNNLIIQNNYIYNCSDGIFLKSANDGWIIRYNYIYDVSTGIELGTNLYYATNCSIYHNIVNIYTASGITSFGSDDTVTGNIFYNNTIRTTGTPAYEALSATCPNGDAITVSMFNNLIVAPSGEYGNCKIDSYTTLTVLDYNLYYPLSFRANSTTYTNISTFRAATIGGLSDGNHDQHSLNAAPTFTNTSGNMNLVSDFFLISGSTGENAGSDGKDMGADVSLVGPSSESGDNTTHPPSLGSGFLGTGSFH